MLLLSCAPALWHGGGGRPALQAFHGRCSTALSADVCPPMMDHQFDAHVGMTHTLPAAPAHAIRMNNLRSLPNPWASDSPCHLPPPPTVFRATYFGENSQIGTPEEAEARFQYFLKGATLPSVAMTGGKLDFKGLGTGWVDRAPVL